MPPENKIEGNKDEEVDIAKAVETAREWIRQNNAGTLCLLQYRLEKVQKNGTSTRYIIIASIVPDIGEERIYHLIKVDTSTGKIVPPVGRGKIDKQGNLHLEEIKVDSKWTD